MGAALRGGALSPADAAAPPGAPLSPADAAALRGGAPSPADAAAPPVEPPPVAPPPVAPSSVDRPLARRTAPGAPVAGRTAPGAPVAGRAATLGLVAAPAVTLLLVVGPVLAGLGGVLAPAFGWFPPLGRETVSLEAFRALAGWPGLAASVRLTATVALGSTALSLAAALLIVAALHGTPAFARARRALSPMLAVPHAAAAFGLAFLIAPSGWAMRALSPWATGRALPPDWPVPGDAWGLSLIAGLVLKETPFLLLMILAALPQAEAPRGVLAARALGRGPVAAWGAAVLPRVWPQIRPAVYAALAYSAAAVDMATVLGPAAPPPLGVQAALWARDPDLAQRLVAAAAAVLLAALTLGLIGLWRGGEAVVARVGRRWLEAGGRGGGERALALLARALAAGLAATMAAALAGLAVWSVAGLWTFPDALPRGWRLDAWAQAGPGLARAAADTALIAGGAAAVALALAVGCLAAEARLGRPGRALWLLYVPLLVPEPAFLIGLQTLALAAGLDGGRLAVGAAHLAFVTPYVFLSLAEPWRAWDARLGLAAAGLGAGPARAFWRLRLPMMLGPLLTAAAVGAAVSASLYLPTLLIGGGRVATLATEAVALASGGDRRLIGATALAQAALPAAGFALALAIPALVWRDRRGMRA
jgi:putative thiamine transport system permease protein